MRDKPADGETVAGPQSGSVATLLLVWSVTLAELRRNPPASLTELQGTVKEFARGLQPDDVRRAARDICRTRRAEICLRRNGASAENR